MSKEDWIWYGHAGHLSVAQWCKFHLLTYVNGFLVSTVGEYYPDRHRKYESLVFYAKKCECGCEEFIPAEAEALEVKRYNCCLDAREGHYELCELFDKKKRNPILNIN